MAQGFVPGSAVNPSTPVEISVSCRYLLFLSERNDSEDEQEYL